MEFRRRELFTTIRTEGAILPPDLLQRVAAGDSDLGGLKPTDYHLFQGEPLNEAIVRSWNRLVGAWAAFGEARSKLPEGDLGTTITRERWLLILFDELDYGRLQAARAVEIDGKSYAVSHGWGEHVPVHLVGCNVPLDRRSQGVAGAAAMSPHGLVQELLNRSDERMWGFVSNGLTLRALRDNSSLTRQAYVEFDLASMMDGEVYADFVVLWLVCHQSRVEGDTPYECWLERWSQEAVKQGTRALDGLRNGVEAAIAALGSGFLVHPANTNLRETLRSGELDVQDYYRELLRLAYRLLFLFVAEDRGLLLDPGATEQAAARYNRFYSTRRLRRLAERRRGSKHADLHQGLRLVMEKLGDDDGCPALGLPALSGYLWSGEAVPNLGTAELPNSALLDAIRALAILEERGVRRSVDYRNLGAEELGSVYESLLELHPELNVDTATFALKIAVGNERKTTGSYYTPTSLISSLLDSALDPALDEAARKGEDAILDLKVVDPACGSGHFLVAAAHRIAKRLAATRTGDDEPSPATTRSALRDVVGHCLYGVDVNPMAVELCKVSLWMEALDPGKPLSFLDAHIKCGNALLGTTLTLIEGGVPDEAFKPIDGDDKEIARSLRKQNKAEREGQLTLQDVVAQLIHQLRVDAAALDAASDDSVDSLHEKERCFKALASSETYRRTRQTADAWCSAFLQRGVASAPRITTGLVRRIASESVALAEVHTLAEQFGLFHWEIEFPEVFGRDAPGFDVVLGNPPWDRIRLDDNEFFATAAPDVVGARTMASRKALIAGLAETDPDLYSAYTAAAGHIARVQRFVHAGGSYPLTGAGQLNLAPLFVERARAIANDRSCVGLIVPSAVATELGNQTLFQDIVESGSLASLYEFENEGFFHGAGHGHMNRFCLLSLTGPGRADQISQYLFQGKDLADLVDEKRIFILTPADFALLNPNTRTCPIFRTRRDADLTKQIYERVPVLLREGSALPDRWGFRGSFMFMMNTDSGRFRVRDVLTGLGYELLGDRFVSDSAVYVPLYEAKMVYQFNHRHGDFRDVPSGERVHQLPSVTAERLQDPDYRSLPCYWVPEKDIDSRLPDWTRQWLIGWRDVTDARASARSVIATIVPRVGVGNGFPLALPDVEPQLAACLLANLNSFVFDYVARQKIGGTHLAFYILHQLPVLSPDTFESPQAWLDPQPLQGWVVSRVVELAYTSWDLAPFAEDVGYASGPFLWSPDRREVLRAELDAAFFHLYGLTEEDVDYVMETFPIVKRRDEQKYGHYRTKVLILDVYRKMAEAIVNHAPYETLLDPPPADSRVAHSLRAALAASE